MCAIYIIHLVPASLLTNLATMFLPVNIQGEKSVGVHSPSSISKKQAAHFSVRVHSCLLQNMEKRVQEYTLATFNNSTTLTHTGQWKQQVVLVGVVDRHGQSKSMTQPFFNSCQTGKF